MAKSIYLHLRAQPGEKTAWQAQAMSEGFTFSEWARRRLNAPARPPNNYWGMPLVKVQDAQRDSYYREAGKTAVNARLPQGYPAGLASPHAGSISGPLADRDNVDAAERDHWSDCATNNAPALPVGACDCGGLPVVNLASEPLPISRRNEAGVTTMAGMPDVEQLLARGRALNAASDAAKASIQLGPTPTKPGERLKKPREKK